MRQLATATAIGLFFWVGVAGADDFTDTLEEAIAAYGAGDIAAARDDLEYALRLLAEAKAEALVTFLPSALPGWTRTEDDAAGGAAMGLGMFGGGTAASARYSRGDTAFTLTLIADSPMVGGMAAMFQGLAGVGGKSFRIQRVEFAETDGQIQGVVGGQVLITVEGSAALEDIRAHLETIDMAALGEF